MQQADIAIDFHGPFKIGGNNGSILFSNQVSRHSGIYLFTVQYNDGYLVYYVGETGKSFFERIKEHAIHYFGGNYRVYDPKAFKNAQKTLIWQGMWQRDTKDRMPIYIDKCHALVPIIRDFLKLLDIFVAPFEAETRLRRRIEGAFARHLRQQPPPIGNFQDDDIRYIQRKRDETPIHVRISCSHKLHGMPSTLLA